LIRRLKRMKPSDPAYVLTFTVLCEYKVMERKLKLLRRA
jgi:hypothetical protein